MNAILLLLALISGSVDKTQQADALFNKGRMLVKSGNSKAACPYFEKSQALEPALGTLLNLGDCYEKTGRLEKAYARFHEAAAWAHRNKEWKREAAAEQRITSLKNKLPRVKSETDDTKVAPSVVQPPAVIAVEPAPVEKNKDVPLASKENAVQKAPAILAPIPRNESSEIVVARTPAPSRTGPVATITTGSILLLSGVVGLVHSFTTYQAMKNQQPGGPNYNNPTVNQAEFANLKWIYPASWAAVGVGAAAIVGGSVWYAKTTQVNVAISPSLDGTGAVGAVSGNF